MIATNQSRGNLASAENTPLTEQGCNAAYKAIQSSSCLAGGKTQGATIELGGSGGYLIGFDPNSVANDS